MRPAVRRCLVATVVLGCGGATCLYSGAGSIEAGGAAMRGTWSPALAFVADLLTAPIPTAGIADVRDVVLLVCAGVVLILSAMTKSALSAKSLNDSHRLIAGATHGLDPITRWMSWCASAVIGLALVSAFAAHSFDLSWGWIVRFAAGAALAIVIAIRFSPAMVRQTVGGLLAVGVLALLLSFWHRANRGYAHFSWPVGPITITGGLAGVWAALAGVLGFGFAIGRGGKLKAAGYVAACLLCVYALQQTERRSPALGLVAGWVIVAAIATWQGYPRRAIRAAICALVALMTVGGTAYVVMQARSAERETSGPIAVRRAYWQESSRFVGSHPFLGVGPDRFVIEMTKAIAPLRAEMPHVYHGNLDTAAHNEWLQAIVELGLSAGLAYAALPIGVLFLVLRSSHRLLAGATQSLVLALAAAIIVIFVCEAASINLRGPILPIWYWTLLGLMAASVEPFHAPQPAKMEKSERPAAHIRPILVAAGGLICLAIAISESLSSVDNNVASLPSVQSGGRLYPEKSLDSRYLDAVRATNVAISSPTPELRSWATDYWRVLFDLLPVYRDTTTRYAESLIHCGKRDEAKRVLESAIRGGMNPYDVSANMLYASLLENDEEGRFRCVQRALRGGVVTDDLILKYATTYWRTGKIQVDELPLARQAATTLKPALLRGATVELLRLHAVLVNQMENNDSMIPSQKLAAECYRQLERENNPYRRCHEAETDAFFRLASMFYNKGPADYREAYDCIIEAERYAVLGIAHEKIAHPDLTLGFVGGEVVPTDFPERLRSLWRLSAMLHMAVGDFRHLDLRVLASMPADHWTAEELRQERAHEAGIIRSQWGRLPQSQWPAHYGQLHQMAAEEAAPHTSQPTTKGRP